MEPYSLRNILTITHSAHSAEKIITVGNARAFPNIIPSVLPAFAIENANRQQHFFSPDTNQLIKIITH
ncbi:MAG: hypothetical protein J6Y82_06260 [Bacteroidales bacterium]|nr:hypothetical protein [Bacteroidales bacterium]